MIPKNLFFIWFGDEEPDYVKFAINTFEEVNPSFKINFLRYTVSQIENKEKVSKFDKDVYKCLDYIVNRKYKNNKYTYYIKYYKRKKRKTLQILSNIVRRMLLDKYGGIYLDCDMFPLKPFDDNLLKHKFFMSKNCNISYVPDNNFMGWNKKNYWKECKLLDVYSKRFRNKKRGLWNERRKLFFKCNLKYEERHCKNYVEHFLDRTWLKDKNNIIRSPICKYDME